MFVVMSRHMFVFLCARYNMVCQPQDMMLHIYRQHISKVIGDSLLAIDFVLLTIKHAPRFIEHVLWIIEQII